MKIEIDDNVLKNFYAAIEEVIKRCTANTEANLFYGTVESVSTEGTGETAVEIAEVKLDGNDFTTPCNVGVNFAKEGDRVVVKINDGEAYIQSNFSKDIIAETLTLTGNSSINLNNAFMVDKDGNMEAKSGKFGNLKIGKIDGKQVLIAEAELPDGGKRLLQYYTDQIEMLDVNKQGTPINGGGTWISPNRIKTPYFTMGDTSLWKRYDYIDMYKIGNILHIKISFDEKVAAGESADYEIEFPYKFHNKPLVFCQPVVKLTSKTYGMVLAAPAEITTNGCSIRFFNDSPGSKSPTVELLIIGY